MYKILIKRLNRNLFEPYMVDVDTEIDTPSSEETDIVCVCGQKVVSSSDSKKVEYSTDDLEELGEKYKELLASYTTEQIKVIEELDVEVLVSIMD